MKVQAGYGLSPLACAALMVVAFVAGCESKDSYEEKLALVQETQALRQEVQALTKDRVGLDERAAQLENDNASLVAVIEIEKVITVVVGESPKKTIIATKTGVRVVQKSTVDKRIQKILKLEHGKAIEGDYHMAFHEAAKGYGSERMLMEFGKFCKTLKKKEDRCP